MSVQPPVTYLDELWTVFDSTRQGHAVGFCVWMLAAMNRHVSYPTYNVLMRRVLKDIRARYKFGYGIHYTGIFIQNMRYFIWSHN
jgi:hypothetical protein